MKVHALNPHMDQNRPQHEIGTDSYEPSHSAKNFLKKVKVWFSFSRLSTPSLNRTEKRDLKYSVEEKHTKGIKDTLSTIE